MARMRRWPASTLRFSLVMVSSFLALDLAVPWAAARMMLG